MRGYEKVEVSRQVDLAKYLGGSALRRKVGFAAPDTPEDLHYEESYEFLIPQDAPIRVRVFADSYEVADKGDDDEALSAFDEVIAVPGEMLVIYPGHCHRVVEKGRFVVLKVQGSYKILAKPDSSGLGCCPNEDCSMRTYCEELGVRNGLRGEKSSSPSPVPSIGGVG